MKIKTFILTFLLMSCPFLFGQSEPDWNFTQQNEYPFSMGILAKVSVNNTPLEDYKLGAFVDGKLRGSNQLEEGNNGFVFLSIHGEDGETITLDAYDNVTKLTYKNVYTTKINTSSINNTVIEITISPVAQIENICYNRLSDAIAAATAGQTIQLLADITEDVTVGKNLTIDGGDFNYTGKISISGDPNVTIQNMECVKGYIEQIGGNTTATLTIKDCSFSNGGYAITTERIKNLNVSGCTVANQSLIYAKLTTTNIYVKDVNIDNGNYLAHIVYNTNATFENVTATNMPYYGICTQNYGAKTITLKGCKFEAQTPLATRDDRTSAYDTFVFEGENIMPNLELAGHMYFKLAEGATLKAPADLNVTTDVEGHVVVYNDGVYSVIAGNVQNATTGKKYATLAKAIDEAAAGDKLIVLQNIELAETVIINKSVELAIVENAQVTSHAYPTAFRIVDGATVTINDFDIISGENGLYNFILGASDGGSEGNLTINGGEFVANTSVASVTKGQLNIFGGEFSLVEGTTDYRYLINCIDASYNDSKATVAITGGTFHNFNPENNLAEGTKTNFCPEYYFGKEDGDIYTVEGPFEAVVAEKTGYTTVEAAIAAATAGQTVRLLGDIEKSAIITIDKAITLDGNNKTLESTAGRAINVDTNGDVVIKNLTINADVRAINVINKPANVTVENVIATAKNNAVMLATSATGAQLIVEDSDFTGLAVVNVASANSNVTINNTNITNLDKTSNENYGAISIFKTATNSFVTVNDGHVIVADDSVGASVGAAEPSDLTFNNTTGNTTIQYVVAYIGDAGYTKLASAIKDAKANQTIELVRSTSISEKVVIEKNITINGNDKTLTYTGSDRAIDIPNNANANVNVTINNLTVNCIASYCQRGINYNDNGELVLNKVTVKGTNVTYALNLPGSSDEAIVTINESNLSGNIALNVWGENATINAENSTFTAVDNNTAEGYAAVKLNNDGATSAEGTVINICGGKIDVTGDACTDTEAVSNGTSTGVVTFCDDKETTINGEIAKMVAVIRYANDQSYSFTKLADAIKKAQDGETVIVINNIEEENIVVIDKAITLDGNGKTLKSSAARGINVDCAGIVNIKNLTIEGSTGCERGINIINQAGTTNLSNVNVSNVSHYAVHVATSAGAAKVNVKDSDLNAWAAIAVYGEGTNVYVENSTLVGTNTYTGESDDFATVAFGNNATINVVGGTITAESSEGKASQSIVCAQEEVVGGNVTLNSTFVLKGTAKYINMNVTDNALYVKADYADKLNAAGFETKALTGEDAGLVQVFVRSEQTLTLAQYWNWFSTYLDIKLDQLQAALGTSGLHIKHYDYYTEYDETYGWLSVGENALTSIEASKMYMIQTSAEIENFNLTGKLVDPSEVEIKLQDNWNWIGYPLNGAYSVSEVVEASTLTPIDGDQIKSHLDGFAQYIVVEGNGNWYGTLKTMKPGCGYMYGNNNGGEKTFTFAYPENDETRGTVEANITAENNYWVPTAQFASNMTMIATLGAGSENYELAAFVNGEVRGSARPIYVEALDAYMFFLTIHGEGVEEVTFKCYDIDTDTEYSLNEVINYSDNAVLGSIREPYVLRGTLGMDEVSAYEVAIYPNPTTTANEINLSTTCDNVEVFNALGVKVAEYQNVDTIDALETAGVYVIRVTNNGNTQNCRLVVK